MTLFVPSPNFSQGREGEHIELVVDHWTVGNAASAIARFKNPDPAQVGGRASAHYIVHVDGSLTQMVNESDTAWHAGDFTANLRSVGIEWEGGPGRDFTDAQYATGARLHRDLAGRHRIPLDAQHVRPHRAIVATQCPGTLDLARIIREAEADMEFVTRSAFEAYQRDVKQTLDAIKDAFNDHTHGTPQVFLGNEST